MMMKTHKIRKLTMDVVHNNIYSLIYHKKILNVYIHHKYWEIVKRIKYNVDANMFGAHKSPEIARGMSIISRKYIEF